MGIKCGQNHDGFLKCACRASKAAELGVYQLLTDLHDDAELNKSEQLLQYGAANMGLSMKKLYFETRHQLSDLLLK